MLFAYNNEKVASKSVSENWLLAFGSAGTCLGLATIGYIVLRNLGSRITFHSPVRGFAMELGTTLTLLTATLLSIPTSTTQCIFGATAAIALCNGNWKALDWNIVFWTFFSWIITVPTTAVISGLLFSLISRAPKF